MTSESAQTPEHTPPPRATHGTRGLLAILLLGALVRGLYLLEQPSFPYFHKPEVDAWLYHQTALRIAGGDVLLGHETLRMSPGYFYFLGAVYRVLGAGPLAPRLIQLLLGLGLVALVWDSARRLWGARWAALPGLVAATYGPGVYFEGHLLAASLAAFLHALLVWQLVRAWPLRRPALRAWALIGLTWGACAVVRPNALPLLLPLAGACVAAARSVRGALPGLAALLVAGALALSPVLVRNLVATGEAVLLTAHGGLNFYVGNGPGATGTWRAPHDVPGALGPHAQFDAFHALAERELGRSVSGREADAYWFGRTRDAILADPLRWLGLLLRKAHLFWNARELHNVYDYEFMRSVSAVIGPWLPQFGWIAPFGLVGTLWMLASAGVARWVAAINLTFCAALVGVFVTDRYRLPVFAPLLLAATWFARRLHAAARARRRGELWGGAAALALACVVAWPVAVHKRVETKYELLGDAWLRTGNPQSAAWAYEKSLQARPEYDPSRFKLARLYAAAGDRALALAQLRELERRATAAGRAESARRARDALDQLGAGAAPPP